MGGGKQDHSAAQLEEFQCWSSGRAGQLLGATRGCVCLFRVVRFVPVLTGPLLGERSTIPEARKQHKNISKKATWQAMAELGEHTTHWRPGNL